MTDFTRHIAALIPADDAAEISQMLELYFTPMGERFFSATPTHRDAEGREYIFIYSSAQEAFTNLAAQLAEAYPLSRFFFAGELVSESQLGDDPYIWRAGGKAMRELVPMATILDGMEPIEEEEP